MPLQSADKQEIAQMQETRDAVLVALRSRLSEIDIGLLVWPKETSLFTLGRALSLTQPVAGILPLRFVNLAARSTNLRS
jgi:hypothetical protein